MRKITGGFVLSLLCLTTVVAAGFSFYSKADTSSDAAVPAPVQIYGTANEFNDGRLSITRQDGDFAGQELIITISDESRVLDAVNGYPISPDEIRSGETIYAYVGPAMTMSLPPITNGEMILSNIPADFRVPDYITVDTLTLNNDGQSGTIRATNGTTYTVPADCQILPYLTRNIVVLADLVKGKNCLIWSEGVTDNAYKIVAFSESHTAGGTDNTVKSYGWSFENGNWYFCDQTGTHNKGWLNDNGNWYYLNPETGIMQTGFLMIDGKTYYLEEDGKMLTKAKTFTPDENGALR